MTGYIIFLDCFNAAPRIIRVVAGVTSGSNLRVRFATPFRKSDFAMTGFEVILSEREGSLLHEILRLSAPE